MKHVLAFPLLLLVGCAVPNAGVESPSPSEDEAAIRAIQEQEGIAVLNQDFATLERIWSEHLIVNNPANQVAPNRTAVLNIFRQGIAHYSSWERTIEQFRIDGDIAVVMGAETVTPIGRAPLAGQTVQRRYTNIWKREAGTWRLWARHANVMIPPAVAPSIDGAP